MVLVEKIRLVRAKTEDATNLADISKSAFDSDIHVGAPGKGGPPGYDSPESQVGMMKWCNYYKILYDGRIVGALIVAKKRAGHYECCRMFVDPEFQNQGVATRAFEMVWEMHKDAKVWTLDTPEWNVRTKHFYEKLGFEQIGWINVVPAWKCRFYEKTMDPNQPYETMKVKELIPGMRQVEVEAKVTEIPESRQTRSRTTGESLRVAEAVISDETGTIKLALWNEQIDQVNTNDKVRICNGYVTSFRGEKQLNIGRYGTLVILI